MLKNYATKNLAPEAQTEPIKTADEQPAEEYFFPGSGEYEPVTVKAASLEAANAKWLEVRKKI